MKTLIRKEQNLANREENVWKESGEVRDVEPLTFRPMELVN